MSNTIEHSHQPSSFSKSLRFGNRTRYNKNIRLEPQKPDGSVCIADNKYRSGPQFSQRTVSTTNKSSSRDSRSDSFNHPTTLENVEFGRFYNQADPRISKLQFQSFVKVYYQPLREMYGMMLLEFQKNNVELKSEVSFISFCRYVYNETEPIGY